MIAQDAGPREMMDDELRLCRKVDCILSKYGPELLNTPLEVLKSMAQEECGAGNPLNVFCRMWDEYRFVPSARWLRRLGRSDTAEQLAIADVMEAVWGE